MLWDLEWIDSNGVVLGQWRRLDRETGARQIQRCLHDRPTSRVYLYRRRGEVSVLVQRVTADTPPRFPEEGEVHFR